MEDLFLSLLLAVIASVAATFFVWLLPFLKATVTRGSYPIFRNKIMAARFEKRIALGNPGPEWHSVEIEVQPGQTREVPYLTWDCMTLFHGLEYMNELGLQFLHLLQDGVSSEKTHLCAVTTPALYFLENIEPHLHELGFSPFSYDKFKIKPKNEWKAQRLILFDLNWNTGSTMQNAAKYFESVGWPAEQSYVLLFNDTVPEEARCKLPIHKPFYLYEVSNIIQHLEDTKLTSWLNITQTAIIGKQSWAAPEIGDAIDKIIDHSIIPDSK